MNNEFEIIISDIVKSTLAYARDEWINEVKNRLNSSRSDYISGISGVYMEDQLNGYIELRGKLPQMLEEGYSGFDIKKGFATSPKRHKKKAGGWYLTVPYRHRTSGNNSVMPNNIKKNASKLGNRNRLEEALVRELGYGVEISHADYTWKNSKYDSLTRIIKEYQVKDGKQRKSSQYLTFRRVSDKSDPKSWIHPGYKGLKALGKVVPKVDKFFYESMENI